jgi:UDP-N-acetylmuramoyl-tripeptide--D-alanyl-D-alanine ligase
MSENLPHFSISDIVAATRGRLLRGDRNGRCLGISTDTRTLEKGNLFVALQGENFDGSDYLQTAADRGASGVILPMERQERVASLPENLPAVGVADTLLAYGALAALWRDSFAIPVIAITGSSGKTTTKEMVAAIASRNMRVLKTEGNFNNQIGLPLTLFKLRKDHRMAILEMGTNSPGEIARLAAIAKPDIGLITNVGPAHLEGLGSLEAVAAEKASLWEVMDKRGTAIINQDDPQLAPFGNHWTGKRVTFGTEEKADVAARNIKTAGEKGVHFDLVIAGISSRVFLSAVGIHNIKNALAAAAATWAAGFSREEIADGLASFHTTPGRSEVRELASGAHLMIDTYNANPYSVAEALKTLLELRGKGKAVAVLGDMLELGKTAEKWHRETGKIVAAGTLDFLFLKGNLVQHLADEAVKYGFSKDNIIFFDDPNEIVPRLGAMLQKDDWVLVKGSRKMKMEAVAEGIVHAVNR